MKISLTFLLCALILVSVTIPGIVSAKAPEFKLTEYLGESWTNERVSFSATIPDGLDPRSIAVRGEDGKTLPAQFVPDEQDSRRGKVYFMVDLSPKAQQTWTLVEGKPDVKTDVFVTEGPSSVDFGTGAIAVRCPLGDYSWPDGRNAEEISAPVQSVRLSDGNWVGTGKLYSPLGVKAFHGQILAAGPVFVKVRLTYEFENERQYTIEFEAMAGEPVVLVSEKYNLNMKSTFLETTRPSNAPSGNYNINAYGRRLYNQGSYWALSFADGLAPDRIALNKGMDTLWGKSTAVGEPPATFALDRKHGPIVTLNPSHGEWWMNCGQWAGTYSTQGKDFLAMMALRAGSWVDPHQNVMVLENDKDGNLRGVLPINSGARTWGLFACDKDDAVLPRGEEPDPRKYPGIMYPRPAQLAAIKYGLLPLDVVKDWTFEFPDPPGTVFPHIYAKAGELGKLRQNIAENQEMKSLIDRLKKQWASYRAKNDPNYPLYPERIMDPRGLDNLYLATGDETYARDLAALLLDRMGFYIHQTKAGVGLSGYRWSHGYGMFHLTTGNLPLFIRESDIALGSSNVTPEQKKDIRAFLAFWGELFTSPDYYSPNYNNGNTDMVTSYNESVGKIASVINGHPKAKEWARLSMTGIIDGLNKGWTVPSIDQDEWYAMLSLEMMTQTAICLKRAGLYDLFQNQKYRDSLDYFGKLLVPPDPRYNGGFVVPFGNGQAQWLRSAVWAVAASAIKDDDPEFASRLMWYWERCGKQGSFRYGDIEPGGWASLGWIDPSIPAKNPDLTSQILPDWGILLRNGTGTKSETYMAMQLGKRNGLNIHFNGEGGMILYAYGMPLILNSGLRSYDQMVNDGYANLTAQRWLANRPSFDFRNEEETTPKTGKLAEWSSSSLGDLATGAWTIRRLVALPNPGPTSGKDRMELSKPRPQVPGLKNGFTDVKSVPAINWRRSVMFVKDTDPAGPNYFIIRDTVQAPVQWDWTISSLAKELDVKDNIGKFTGKFGVDLNLVPLSPVPELVTGAWGPSDSFAGDWRQKLYQVQLPGSGEMAAVLFPRLHGHPEPAITPWAGGQGAKIMLPDAVHYVLLSDSPVKADEGGMSIDGRAASVILKGSAVTLNLLSGTRISTGDIELITEGVSGEQSGAVALTIDKNTRNASGESHGPALSITLRLPREFDGCTLLVDGSQAAVIEAGRQTTTFSIPQGDHVFTIR